MAGLGSLLMLTVLSQLSLFGRQWDIHAMIGGTLLLIVGTQVVALGLCAQAYGVYYMAERDPRFEPMEPSFARLNGGEIRAWGRLETELGSVEKVVTIDGEAGTVEIEAILHWPELPSGSLRAAHLVLRPAAFDSGSLFYAAHNGGEAPEFHAVSGRSFDLGGPVSTLVSARQGLGVTEGVLLMGDVQRTVRMEIDQSVCKPLALVGLTPSGPSFFFRAALSVTESDDTRRGGIPRPGNDPQRVRVVLSAESTPAR